MQPDRRSDAHSVGAAKWRAQCKDGAAEWRPVRAESLARRPRGVARWDGRAESLAGTAARSRSRDGRAELLAILPRGVARWDGRAEWLARRPRGVARWDGRADGGAHWHHEVAAIQPARASGFATIPPPPLLPDLGQLWFRTLPVQAAAAPQRQRACVRAHGTSARMAWQPEGICICELPVDLSTMLAV